jgi:hypothetical protein
MFETYCYPRRTLSGHEFGKHGSGQREENHRAEAEEEGRDHLARTESVVAATSYLLSLTGTIQWTPFCTLHP